MLPSLLNVKSIKRHIKIRYRSFLAQYLYNHKQTAIFCCNKQSSAVRFIPFINIMIVKFIGNMYCQTLFCWAVCSNIAGNTFQNEREIQFQLSGNFVDRPSVSKNINWKKIKFSCNKSDTEEFCVRENGFDCDVKWIHFFVLLSKQMRSIMIHIARPILWFSWWDNVSHSSLYTVNSVPNSK